MADNVGLPLTGAGDSTATVATDDVGGAHFQYVKIASAIADSSAMILDSTSLPAVDARGFAVRTIDEAFAVCSRTSVASSVDVSLFAASSIVRARVITAVSTTVDLLLNFSTNVVSSASTGYDYRLVTPGSLRMPGDMPLWTGAIRCKVNSTTANTVAVGLQFST